jgi:prolipoprotein diacylglyceryl transferase
MLASIPSPARDSIDIGPLHLRAYGLMIAIGVYVAVRWARARWEARGGTASEITDLAVWCVPAGLVGARLYHVITDWQLFRGHWIDVLKIWQGGLGIWGAIAGGAIAGVIVARRRGLDLPTLFDVAAPVIPVAQAIGRFGNWFNQELFGRPTDLPWALEIARDHRPERYIANPTFHPTFLYELLWNLALATALVWIDRHRPVRPPGLFALYVAGYCSFRICDELLRVDTAAHVLGLRWNLLVAIAGTAIGVAWFVATQRPTAREGPLLQAIQCAQGDSNSHDP